MPGEFSPQIATAAAWRAIGLLVSIAVVSKASGTVLSDAAETLQPGESLVLTTSLTADQLTPDGQTFLIWASSAPWDPRSREMRFVGKRAGPNAPHRVLTYREEDDSWNLDVPSPLPDGSVGHGYDQNAVDAFTGASYFRASGSPVVYRWAGSQWEELPSLPGATQIAGSISWVPTVGLLYVDVYGMRRFWDGRWEFVDNFPDARIGYHAVSEYNASSRTLVFGAGNTSEELWFYNSNGGYTPVADPPLNVGASSTQGLITTDPASAQFVAWSKTSGEFFALDVGSNSWRSLPRAPAPSQQPVAGAPALEVEGGAAVIATAIQELGVIMYVQARGESEPRVWLYRHSAMPAQPVAPQVQLQ